MKGAAILLLGLFVAAVAAQAKCPLAELLMQKIDECKESLNPSDEVLQLISKGEGEDNREVNCFQACLGSKIGLDLTNLDIDKMESLMRSSENANEEAIKGVVKIVTKCKEEVEETDDACKIAGGYFKCVRAATSAA